MKKMTQAAFAVLICSSLLFLINGCKKGEDDPFFSIRTRKNRIEGEWRLSTCSGSYKFSRHTTLSGQDHLIDGDSTIALENNDLNIAASKTISTSFNPSVPNSYFHTEIKRNVIGIISQKMVFSKDGTFTGTLKINNLEVTVSTKDDKMTEPFTSNDKSKTGTIETKGTWHFNGGPNDDYKKKELIILDFLEETSSLLEDGFQNTTYNTKKTYAHGERQETWAIRELRHTKMVIETKTNQVTNEQRSTESNPSITDQVVTDESLQGQTMSTYVH